MEIKENFSEELHFKIQQKIIECSDNILSPKLDFSEGIVIGYYLYDDKDQLVGGIAGHHFWNMMHIDFFWLDDSVRGQGHGTELLQKMEDFARKEKCKLINLETFTFQAPHFYEKNGYTLIGKVENIPIENCDYLFYKKELH